MRIPNNGRDEAPRLTEELGGPRILVKRDDLTGVAFGGNKIREFEYSLAPAVVGGYDVLVNGGGSQSNQSRQTAAVAAKLGMHSVIIARKDAHSDPVQANLLLCYLLGAEVQLITKGDVASATERVMERLRREGHKPYHTGSDGRVLRCVAYVDGFLELLGQLSERGVTPDALYICAGRHSYVGLVVAAKVLGVDLRVVGIPYSSRRDDAENAQMLADQANRTALVLGLDMCFEPRDIETYVEFTGPGYGVVTREGQEAIHLAARTEGLVLDPVYTGKAMAGLIAHIAEGQFNRDQTVVFVHTGGTPGLFAYGAELGLAL